MSALLETIETTASEESFDKPESVKPRLRGWIHFGAFCITLTLSGFLISSSTWTGEAWAMAIYALGLAVMFGTSALFHLVTWGPKGRRRMRRADHSTIFLGIAAAAMSDPDWADHALCDKNVGPFACEVWVSRASIVFIEVGTGDQYEWKEFEKNYRPLIAHALKKGALPVLVTKADDLEARNGAPSGYINNVIRTLADEYNVPLLDFWQATRALPNNGLIDEEIGRAHV